MKICVVRPAEYEYKIKSKSLYDSYNHLATNDNEVSLVLDKEKIDRIKERLGAVPEQIVSGMLERNSGTALLLNKRFCIQNQVIMSSYLNEIKYDMIQIISKEDFTKLKKNATNQTRKLFVKKLTDNNLTEPFSEVMERVERSLAMFSGLQANRVLAVSNSFFMKVLEYVIMCRTQNYKITSSNYAKFYDGCKPAYDFLDGFSFRIEKGIIYREEVI